MLLSPTNRVRAIITKAALQEGWDCPFAYVLCSLANVAANAAMTQLIGRILRQPGAEPTGVASLDECYVIARYAAPAAIIATIAEGLKRDGLGDIANQIRLLPSGTAPIVTARFIQRRPEFQAAPIQLPHVVWVDASAVDDVFEARPLDYETDIFSALDWRKFDVSPLVRKLPQNARATEGMAVRLALSGGIDMLTASHVAPLATRAPLDPIYLVRMISDIIQNPWVAYDVVAGLLDGLRARGLDEAWQTPRTGFILEALRSFLIIEQDRMLEQYFREQLAKGHIQFRLRADGLNWSMPRQLSTLLPAGASPMLREDGYPLIRSLFAPVYRDEFSSEPERHVAVYLDGEDALRWWHRNAAASRGFHLQGWRKHLVYPDFILSRTRASGDRIVAVEMKGEHLMGNDDTKYKKALFDLLSGVFTLEDRTAAGTLHLTQADGVTVECRMVLLDDWQVGLPPLLAAG